jgi:hypothetical protein
VIMLIINISTVDMEILCSLEQTGGPIKSLH